MTHKSWWGRWPCPLHRWHKVCPSPVAAQLGRLKSQGFCPRQDQGGESGRQGEQQGWRSPAKEVDGNRGPGHSRQGSIDDRLQKRAWLLLSFCRTAFKSHCAALGEGTVDQVSPPVPSGPAPSPFPGPRHPRKQRGVSTSLPPPADSQQ